MTVPLGVPVTFMIHNSDPIDHEWIVGDAAVHERHRTGTEPVHGARPTEVTIPAGETVTTTVDVRRGRVAAVHLPPPRPRGVRDGRHGHDRPRLSRRARDTDRAPRRREARPGATAADRQAPGLPSGTRVTKIALMIGLWPRGDGELDVEHAVGHLDDERLVERGVARPGLLDDVE